MSFGEPVQAGQEHVDLLPPSLGRHLLQGSRSRWHQQLLVKPEARETFSPPPSWATSNHPPNAVSSTFFTFQVS